MGLAIAFMILALCFMFISGVLFEGEVKPCLIWALASVGTAALALCLAGGVF